MEAFDMILEVSQSPIGYTDHKEITQFILIKNVLFLDLRGISFINVAFTNRHQRNLRGDLRDSGGGLRNWHGEL